MREGLGCPVAHTEGRGAIDIYTLQDKRNVNISRGQALQALANREGAEVMPQLWQALRDPDPGVRILAIENVGSGEQGKALLEEALSDQDEAVRAVATARLKAEGLEGDPL